MDLETKLLISITVGFLNIILPTYVPALMIKDNRPFMKKVKTIFNNKKKKLITTSILISILVFVILSINQKLDTISSQYLFTNDENSSIFYSPDSYKLSSTSSSMIEANMFISPSTVLPNISNTDINNDISTLNKILETNKNTPLKTNTQVENISKLSKLSNNNNNNDIATANLLDKMSGNKIDIDESDFTKSIFPI